MSDLDGEIAEGETAGEDQPAKPLSPYGCSKASFELYLRAFGEFTGLRYTILRYANVYGPRQDPKSEYAAVIPKFAVAAIEGKSPIVYGDGGQTRDFTYVADAVEANWLAATVPASPKRPSRPRNCVTIWVATGTSPRSPPPLPRRHRPASRPLGTRPRSTPTVVRRPARSATASAPARGGPAEPPASASAVGCKEASPVPTPRRPGSSPPQATRT